VCLGNDSISSSADVFTTCEIGEALDNLHKTGEEHADPTKSSTSQKEDEPKKKSDYTPIPLPPPPMKDADDNSCASDFSSSSDY